MTHGDVAGGISRAELSVVGHPTAPEFIAAADVI